MGKPSQKSNKTPNKGEKVKEIKKSQAKVQDHADEKQIEQKPTEKRNQISVDSTLKDKNECLNSLHKLTHLLVSKIGDVSRLYSQLEGIGLGSHVYNKQNFIEKVGQSGEKAGVKALRTLVIDAQNDIFDCQRDIFKKISNLENIYNKFKDVLQDAGSFNDVQIDETIEVVQKKIEQHKQTLVTLNSIVSKGNLVLGEKNEPQN